MPSLEPRRADAASTANPGPPRSVLLVEDDDAYADLVIEALEEAFGNLGLKRVVRLKDALHHLATTEVDVVLLDLSLPDAFDLVAVTAISAAAPDVPVVVLTGSMDASLGSRAMAAGAHDYLQKGQVDANLLLRSLRYARERHAYLLATRTAAAKKHKRAEFLVKVGDVLSVSLDFDATLAAVASVALPELASWCVVQAHGDGDRPVRRAVAGSPPADAPASDDVAAVRRSMLVVPLTAHGKPLGTLQLGRPDDAAVYDEDDLDLAVELARRAAVALENARLYQVAQSAIERRDLFLSIASHELRTPLQTLQLQIDQMQQGVQLVPPTSAVDLSNRLKAAERQTKRLARLVTTLFDVSLIAAGDLVIDPKEMDLAELAREVAELHANASRIELLLHGNSPVLGVWDRLRLEQVMTNLLGNATKYGAGKPVALSIVAEPAFATFSVRDQGIGIAHHDLGRIFERFERAVSPRHYGGLGLGLFVSRQIVEAHHGTIAVESAVGLGSSFTVRLPRLRAAARPVAELVAR